MISKSVAFVRQTAPKPRGRSLVWGFLICLWASPLNAQRGRSPAIEQEEPDSTGPLSAQDSAYFRARITAAENPFHECKGQAFQTCASGELAARLSSDGTAYGVLFTRNIDGRSLFLWRITRGGGGGGGAGGGGRGRGGGGGGRGKRRG
jgi:hypothetical protein